MRHSALFLAAAIVITATGYPSSSALGADNKKTYTTVKEAKKDPDFLIQGEYAGELKTDDGESFKVGFQCIALGNGKFRGVGYEGGLPGDGYTRDLEKVQGEGQLKDGVVAIKLDEHHVKIKNGVVTVFTVDGDKQVGQLKKVERKSKTLGAKPPKGAVVLFDGTEETFKKNWQKGARIKDGLLQAGCKSIPAFQDFKLHIEFQLPYKPHARGQGRGNSGIYYQARFETQMLDSFGLEGKHNECGGIYSIKDPDVNACFPPLSWQTYDVDFTAAKFDANGKKTKNARITVRLNGIIVHKDVELPKSTTASPMKEGPQPGPIYLQNHGNPVVYRNIWVVEKK